MADHARQGLHDARHTLGVVKVGPGVLDAVDLVGQQPAGEHTVRQAIARVTGDDVNLVVTLVLADESHVVHGLEDLAGPLVVGASSLGEALTSPLLELIKAGQSLLLADLMVAATDDHVIVFVVALGQTHVLVLLGVVIEQTVLDGALGHAHSDAVGAVILELGDDAQLLEGDAGGLDGVLGLDGVAALGSDFDGLVAHAEKLDALLLDIHDAGTGVALEVGLGLEPVEHANEVAGGVEGGLVVGDHAAALVDGGGPAADGQIGLLVFVSIALAE